MRISYYYIQRCVIQILYRSLKGDYCFLGFCFHDQHNRFVQAVMAPLSQHKQHREIHLGETCCSVQMWFATAQTSLPHAVLECYYS